MAAAAASVEEMELYTDKGEQLVDILHNQVNDNTCLRISDKRFSTARRDTPSYSKLLAISNVYGYVVAGTPNGLSVFKTADALEALSKGTSKGTNTAVMLDSRKDISLAGRGDRPTHVDISADGLSVVVATTAGQILVFSASSLVENGPSIPEKTISVGSELRDMRANPLDAPTIVAALKLSGELLVLDMATGSCKTIFTPQSDEERITSICWSRKGKQIVCGDLSAVLTQRLPTDGTAKRVIEPQATDGNILDESSVLAVDWIDTYTFFIVYGVFPDGGFIPGSGGGGTGAEDGSDSGGGDDNVTAAYVVTQENKRAPMQWLYIEDPCSSMMRPERYPGFHIACISNWGASAKNIVIMAGTSSDATMTIGHAATSESADGSADESTAAWAQWDIDGNMAVMPLSAISTDNSADSDTFPIGIAIDYTSKIDLPPITDESERVGPAPILWILNTDGCLLAYHIYNVFEMSRGNSCPNMVASVQQLPGAVGSSGAKPFAASTFGSSASAETNLPAFASKPAGKSGLGGFGSSVVSGFGFGKTSQASSMPKGPTAAGVSGQPVFGGSGTKIGGAKLGGSSGFGGFGQAADGAVSLGKGQSIFDAPSGTASIFDGASEAGSGTSSSMFKPYTPANKTADNVPKSIGFGNAFQVKAAKPTPADNTQFNEEAKPSTGIFGGSSSFGGFGKGLSESSSTSTSSKQDSKDSRPAASVFGGFSSFGMSLGKTVPTSSQDSEAKAKGSEHVFDKPSAFGEFGAASKQPTHSAMSAFASRDIVPAKASVSSAKNVGAGAVSQRPNLSKEMQKREEAEQRKEKEKQEAMERKLRAEREKQETEQRKEKEKQETMQRELEAKTGEMIRKQYILTCNRMDREIYTFGKSLWKTEKAISQVRSSRLPPIAIDPSVEQLASLSRRMDEMSIDDTNAWNTVADCLLEALQVSRDELKASQKILSKQISDQLKMETKREEISRILETSMSTRATSSSTFDGGLNPIQRDYQRRLKRAFNMIGKRTKDVEQVVDMEAERLESKYNSSLPPALRAPTTDSIQRTLGNVTRTLEQKNEELSLLAARIDAMDLDSSRPESAKPSRKPKLEKKISFTANLQPTGGSARPASASASASAAPAALLRTAASGTPWSPHNLPLSSPPLGRRRGGFGLRPEDLVASDTPVTKDSGATRSNPLFPNAQVRELVPRSAKSLRKTSVVLDDDDATAATVSGFSNAAAYALARKQRSIVRDVLTRSNRAAAVLRTPESAISRAFKFGTPSDSVIPARTPMPNLERYVRAFGKLKIEESEPESEYETEPEYESEPEPEYGSALEPSRLSFGVSNMSPALIGTSLVLSQQGPLEAQSKPLGAVDDLFGTVRQDPPPLFVNKPSRSRPLLDDSSITGTVLFGSSSQAPVSLASDTFDDSPSKPVGRPLFGESQQKSLENEFKPLDSAGSSLFGSRLGAPVASQEKQPNASRFLTFGTASPKPSGGSLAFGGLTLSSRSGGTNSPASQADEWTCKVCELKNPQSATQCTICEAPRPGAQPEEKLLAPKTAASTSTAAFGVFKPTGWLSQEPAQSEFPSSASLVPDSSKKDLRSALPDLPPLKPKYPTVGDWTCEVCELKNPQSATKCTICDTGKPGTGSLPAQKPKTTSSGSNSGGFKPSPELSFESSSFAPAKPVVGSPKGVAEPPSSTLFGGFKPSDGLSLGSALLKDTKPEPTSEVAATASDAKYGGYVAGSASDHSPDYTDDDGGENPKDGLESDGPGQPLETPKDEFGETHSENEERSHAVQSPDAGEEEEEVAKVEEDPEEKAEIMNDDGAEQRAGGRNLSSPTSEPEKKPEQDHDSDGFVHVSQLESGHESKDDVSNPATEMEADSADIAAQLVSELGQHLSGTAPDQLVDFVFSTVEKDSKDETASPADASKKEDIPSVSDTEETKEESQQSEARTSDEFVVLSQTESIDDVAAASDSESELSSSHKSAFGLDDIAKGIDAVSSDNDAAAAAVSNDEESDQQSDAESGVSSESSSAQPSKLAAQRQPDQPKASDSASFFKSGRLGNFGSFGSKSPFGPGQTSLSLPASADGSKALPNAFAGGVSKKAAVPAFGAKLDRPAFGVASMSSYDANKRSLAVSGSSSQGSFASMGNITTGFGARGAADADPFAAYRKAKTTSPAGAGLEAVAASDASSVFSNMSKEVSPEVVARAPSTSVKEEVTVPSSSAEHDPIRDIIDNDGFEDSKSASDTNDYDSE